MLHHIYLVHCRIMMMILKTMTLPLNHQNQRWTNIKLSSLKILVTVKLSPTCKPIYFQPFRPPFFTCLCFPRYKNLKPTKIKDPFRLAASASADVSWGAKNRLFVQVDEGVRSHSRGYYTSLDWNIDRAVISNLHWFSCLAFITVLVRIGVRTFAHKN